MSTVSSSSFTPRISLLGIGQILSCSLFLICTLRFFLKSHHEDGQCIQDIDTRLMTDFDFTGPVILGALRSEMVLRWNSLVLRSMAASPNAFCLHSQYASMFIQTTVVHWLYSFNGEQRPIQILLVRDTLLQDQ